MLQISVQNFTDLPLFFFFLNSELELVLMKSVDAAAARRDVLDIAHIFRARSVDVSGHAITLKMKPSAH